MMSVERLQVPNTFEWNASKSGVQVSAVKSAISPDTSAEKRKKKKAKKEEEIQDKERFKKLTTFDASTADYLELDTAEECERLVGAYPSSSKAWVLYMAFYLKQSEVERARNIAIKALKTIPFRHEDEKFNVSVALLNLENLYGTEESLKEAFSQALLYSDAKRIHVHLAELYTKSEKYEEAEQLLEIMVQKFKHDVDVWIMFISLCMKFGNSEKAHSLMNKSFLILDKKFHADVMGKVAHLECDYGNLEKGKALFENIVLKYPKRRDLISIYISVLKRSGEVNRVEQLSPLLGEKGKV